MERGETVHYHYENIILFPKWQTTLEKEILLDLEQKKYTDALAKLNKLLNFKVNKHEIFIGKLICLMELGEYEEAEDFCDELLSVRDENYYHYLHIYLTILFQTNQYDILMEQVDLECANNTIPNEVNDQFQQLYNMSKKMRNDIISEKSTVYLKKLTEAITEKDHAKQWQLIESLRRMKLEPTQEIIQLLVGETVHPVTKTAIFHWLQDNEIKQSVDIHKLQLQLNVRPTDIATIKSHMTIKQTMLLISDIEQKNPSLFRLLEQLLFRYVYVRYPIIYPNEDTKEIANALVNIGEEYLNIYTKSSKLSNDNIKYYTEEIKMCENLYLSIIEE